MNPAEIQPPKWSLKFLRFFVKKEYLEEIEGDMEEIFFDSAEQFSHRKAKRIYTWEILKLLRPILMKNLEGVNRLNQYGMLKNYFKVSFRGLMKSPVNSFINLFGLAISIGLCVFAYAFARWTYSTDQFHEHKHSVYLATFFANRDGVEQQYGTSPRPLGEMLRNDFAQIKNVCRIEDRSVVMKHEDHVFHERVRYVDPEFLELFTFPLKWGAAKSLTDVNSIILSESASIKYFGEENPIGQIITMIYGEDQSKTFKVLGVAAEFPKARTISFDFLINFENFRTTDPAYDLTDWNSFVNATLIQVNDPADLKTIENNMGKYKTLQNQVVKEDWTILSFAFEPLATLHERSEYIKDDISRSSKTNYISIIFIIAISVLMLALACSNYINISIATAVKRLKEIGVRKSIGATRKVVIIQFLTENLVITFFAMIVGLILGYTFFIPGFERLWHFSMDFRLVDVNLWIYLPIILIITSIASGIYPAFYISKFQVVGILKGSIKFGQKNPLTKVFLGFQLILACIFITMSVMFTQNTTYLSHRSWGYNQADALYAMVPDQASFERLSAIMRRNPNVISITGSTHHVGKNHKTSVLHFPERDYEVDQLSVDPNYFVTLGLQLKQGRTFHDFESSDQQSVVINEALATTLGENPIGKVFRIDSIQYEVIGVIKDFHSYKFSQIVRPLIFKLAQKSDYRFLTLRSRPDSEMEAYKALQAGWADLFPEIPFEGGLQEDVWGFYFQEISIYKLVWRVFASLAVALAILGLYGLVRLNVEGRTKEFSIRKVLGASVKNIAVSVSRQYLILFLLALVIGGTCGHLAAQWLINFTYVYHMPITLSSVSIAIVLMILVLLLTVSTQIGKVMKANPIDGLKAE